MHCNSLILESLFFSKRFRTKDWQHVTVEGVYIILVLFMLMGTVQESSVSLHITDASGSNAHFWLCHVLGYI
jgi:hypothetical protein